MSVTLASRLALNLVELLELIVTYLEEPVWDAQTTFDLGSAQPAP